MWLKSSLLDTSNAKKVTRRSSESASSKSASSKSRATTILKAMSNSQRLKILSNLIDGEEKSVKELETIVKSLSQSSLSQHLGRLRRAKIVKTRRHSQMVFYSIHDDTVRDIISLLAEKFKNDPILNKTPRFLLRWHFIRMALYLEVKGNKKDKDEYPPSLGA